MVPPLFQRLTVRVRNCHARHRSVWKPCNPPPPTRETTVKEIENNARVRYTTSRKTCTHGGGNPRRLLLESELKGVGCARSVHSTATQKTRANTKKHGQKKKDVAVVYSNLQQARTAGEDRQRHTVCCHRTVVRQAVLVSVLTGTNFTFHDYNPTRPSPQIITKTTAAFFDPVKTTLNLGKWTEVGHTHRLFYPDKKGAWKNTDMPVLIPKLQPHTSITMNYH